jgi:DNA-binding MarR family transcriptional regulator
MPDQKKDRIAESLSSLVRLFHVMRARACRAGEKPLGPEYWTLIFLSEEELPISELGRRLQRSKSNMTAMIDRMMGDGLLRRSHDRGDRRVVRVSISAGGRAYLREKRAQMKESIRKNLAMLSSQELDSLCASLDSVTRIAAKLERVK